LCGANRIAGVASRVVIIASPANERALVRVRGRADRDLRSSSARTRAGDADAARERARATNEDSRMWRDDAAFRDDSRRDADADADGT
jgi:hypothetical protein